MKQQNKTRVTIQYSGDAAKRIFEAGQLLGINHPGDVVRYLAQRGLESMSTQLHARRMMLEMESKLDPQQMLDLALKFEKGGDL